MAEHNPGGSDARRRAAVGDDGNRRGGDVHGLTLNQGRRPASRRPATPRAPVVRLRPGGRDDEPIAVPARGGQLFGLVNCATQRLERRRGAGGGFALGSHGRGWIGQTVDLPSAERDGRGANNPGGREERRHEPQ